MYDWPPHTISPAPIAWTNVGESLTLIYNSSYYSEWVTFAHHSASGVKYYEIGVDYYDEYLAACVEETFPVLYQVFCVDLTNHMIFTIPNITEDNHNDVWSVKSTEEPEAVNTTVFIRGKVEQNHKLEIEFMKHCAHRHILVHKDDFTR